MKDWCWKGSFVNEAEDTHGASCTLETCCGQVRFLAESRGPGRRESRISSIYTRRRVDVLPRGQNMPLAWLNIKTAQSLFRQDPSFEQARTTRPLKMGCMRAQSPGRGIPRSRGLDGSQPLFVECGASVARATCLERHNEGRQSKITWIWVVFGSRPCIRAAPHCPPRGAKV